MCPSSADTYTVSPSGLSTWSLLIGGTPPRWTSSSSPPASAAIRKSLPSPFTTSHLPSLLQLGASNNSVDDEWTSRLSPVSASMTKSSARWPGLSVRGMRPAPDGCPGRTVGLLPEPRTPAGSCSRDTCPPDRRGHAARLGHIDRRRCPGIGRVRTRRRVTALVAAAVALAAAAGCGGADDVAARPAVTVPAEVVATRTFPPAVPAAPLTFEAPPPPMTSGNPAGTALVPAEAQAVDTSQPTRVIGDGNAESCTSQAVVDAVAGGGIITFDCGAAPGTITMTATAKVANANGPVVLDGGGLVTLSGGGERRILYMNTCDEAQGWTTSHCQDQDHPQLVVQNLTFADGNSTGELTEGGGGGAIFVRGGRFRVVSSVFL